MNDSGLYSKPNGKSNGEVCAIGKWTKRYQRLPRLLHLSRDSGQLGRLCVTSWRLLLFTASMRKSCFSSNRRSFSVKKQLTRE